MNKIYYDMIFKRKSFHTFKDISKLSSTDIKEIENKFNQLVPLIKDIKVSFKIVPKENTTCKRGEYCILMYSEKKDNYLQNIGFLGGQLDLWLASKNIGVCWYGVGKTEQNSYNELEFVIMLAIGKTEEKYFRKNYLKATRKPINEIFNGEKYNEIVEVIRFAPSSCNSQPWFIECVENQLLLFRVSNKRGIMPKDKVSYYNNIDLGIMIFFMEICLNKEKYNFKINLHVDDFTVNNKVLNAEIDIF